MVNLMLDSGAFSAFTKKADINIQDYIKFIKENEKCIECYVNMDVIGDAEGTYKNQQIMKKAGLNPIPVFHSMFEDDKWLIKYIKEGYDYIGLGGMAGTSFGKKDLMRRLDHLFAEVIGDAKGYPKVKIHGFGMTSREIMARYPWYSVDSTSWVMTSRFGAIYIPQKRNGKWEYGANSWKVNISARSPSKEVEGKHFQSFTPMEQKIILEYIEMKGFKLGQSVTRKENPKTYKLRPGERWLGKEECDAQRSIYGNPQGEEKKLIGKGKEERLDHIALGYKGDGLVEVPIEYGLTNDYRQRDKINIIYFLDLEKNLPKWPWPFKVKRMGGFFS